MNGENQTALVAQFVSADALLDAARVVRAAGYNTGVEAYSPFPIAGLCEAVGSHSTHVAPVMLLGGLVGGIGTFALQWYSAVIDYPINVGGRPLFSWPAFVPAAIEMTILFAAVFGIFAMLVGNGLPRLHHRLFALPGFERASDDRFFLLVRTEPDDQQIQRARDLLKRLSPVEITQVTHDA